MKKQVFWAMTAALLLLVGLAACAPAEEPETEEPPAVSGQDGPEIPDAPGTDVQGPENDPAEGQGPDAQDPEREPDAPDAPDTPDTPDIPDTPDVPDTPDTPVIQPFSGEFTPEGYAAFLSEAIGAEVPLTGRFPFSTVYAFFPEIRLPAETWTVYIVQVQARDTDHMEVEDLTPLAEELPFPKDMDYDAARPVYSGGGGGSGELEVIVELTKAGETAAYISYDNFTYVDETDALLLLYRGALPEWRVLEMREQGLL